VVAADVSRREYTHCADDAAVVLYTVQGGGHTWPGGGPLPEWFVGRTSNSIDASSEMWAFFREHRLLREGGNTRAAGGGVSRLSLLARAAPG
jgi:polyhydroxybutyrate depolymerase